MANRYNRRVEAVLGVFGTLLMAVAGFVGFAALAYLGRYLVLGWLWILLPLGLPVLLNNCLAIALAGASAWIGWRLIRFFLPDRGPKIAA